MKSIRKPSLKRYPKRPKAGATLQAWERYNAKCGDVEKENSKLMAEYKKKVAVLQAAKKKKETIMNKTKGLSGIALPKGKK